MAYPAEPGPAEEALAALARDLVEEISAGRALELAQSSGDEDLLDLTAFRVRPFERRSPSGKPEYVHGYQESRLGARLVQGEPSHLVTGISEPQWLAGEREWQAKAEAAWKAGRHTSRKNVTAGRVAGDIDKTAQRSPAAAAEAAQDRLQAAQRHLGAGDLGKAHQELGKAHQQVLSQAIPHAKPEDYPALAQHLQRISGHMQDLDQAAGKNPQATRKTLGTAKQALAHAGEDRRAGETAALQDKATRAAQAVERAQALAAGPAEFEQWQRAHGELPPLSGAAAIHPGLGHHLAAHPGDSLSGHAYAHVPRAIPGAAETAVAQQAANELAERRQHEQVLREETAAGLEQEAARAAARERRAQRAATGTIKHEPDLVADARQASPEEFAVAFEGAFKGSPYSAFVSHHTPADIREQAMVPILAAGGKAGVLIHDHGDGRIEPTGLFNVSGNRGMGLALARLAMDKHGANYVEAYGPVLNKLYEGLGFRDTAAYAFDPSQAAPEWDYPRFDHPDYHTMTLVPQEAAVPGKSVPGESGEKYAGQFSAQILEYHKLAHGGAKQELNLASASLDAGEHEAAVTHLREAARLARADGYSNAASDYTVLAARIEQAHGEQAQVHEAVHAFTGKAAVVVPGLLGGGKEEWNGHVDLTSFDGKPYVLAEIDWNGRISIRDTVAKSIQAALADPQATVQDPSAFSVVLHELVHGVIGGQTAQQDEEWQKLNTWDQALIETMNELDRRNVSGGAYPTLHSLADIQRENPAFIQDHIDRLARQGLAEQSTSTSSTWNPETGETVTGIRSWKLTGKARAMVPSPEQYRDHLGAYQEKRTAQIEEGFTELGTVQHMPEFLDQMGIGNRGTNITAFEGGHVKVNPVYAKVKAAVFSKLADQERALSADLRAPQRQAARAVQRAAQALNEDDLPGAEDELSALRHLGDPDVFQAVKVIQAGLDKMAATGFAAKATMAEYAKRLQDPERITEGNAWGHYAGETAAALKWVSDVAAAERVRGRLKVQSRVRELSDEINRQGPAGKIPAMAAQVLRAAGVQDQPTDAGKLSEVLALMIRDNWIPGQAEGDVTASRKALRFAAMYAAGTEKAARAAETGALARQEATP